MRMDWVGLLGVHEMFMDTGRIGCDVMGLGFVSQGRETKTLQPKDGIGESELMEESYRPWSCKVRSCPQKGQFIFRVEASNS